MPDTCVFCGSTGTDFKPEHWVPKWVSRATIPKGKGVLHITPGRDPWLNRHIEMTVRHVCPDCNHHWMSDMEVRVRDIALPLIRGDNRTLSSQDQERLAAWCFLKAVTLELGRPPAEAMTYPDVIYRGLYKFKQPPAPCSVEIGFRESLGEPPLFVWLKSQGQIHHAIPGMGDLGGYRTAFSIGHLVADIFGVIGRVSVQTDGDERLIRIWPVQAETLDWPPALRFNGIVGNELV